MGKKLIWCVALIFMLCGCEKRQMSFTYAKPVEAVRSAVEKFSRGGEGWGWVQYHEIKREVQAITNSDKQK